MNSEPVDYAKNLKDEATIVALLQEGVRAAVRMHKFLGNPVATYRDGNVVWIAPEDINDDGTANLPPE